MTSNREKFLHGPTGNDVDTIPKDARKGLQDAEKVLIGLHRTPVPPGPWNGWYTPMPRPRRTSRTSSTPGESSSTPRPSGNS